MIFIVEFWKNRVVFEKKGMVFENLVYSFGECCNLGNGLSRGAVFGKNGG